jgi:hypothetical protein
MSELRDLTLALRAFDKRFMSIEDCLLELVRDSKQQSEWRHLQKNRAQTDDGLQLQREKAILQVQEACGAISSKLAEFSERLETLATVRGDDVRELKGRLNSLETRVKGEEVTQT